MKFLCVCDGGNVRSHAMAYVLHDEYHHEAIAVGRLRVKPETMATLCAWSDVIIVMEPHMTQSIPDEFARKIICVDVGPDNYGMMVHPDLLKKVRTGGEWISRLNFPRHD